MNIMGSIFLTIVFIVLKLFGVINWAWLWVLCPLWIPFAAIVIVLVIVVFLIGILSLFP